MMPQSAHKTSQKEEKRKKERKKKKKLTKNEKLRKSHLRKYQDNMCLHIGGVAALENQYELQKYRKSVNLHVATLNTSISAGVKTYTVS